MKKGLLFISFLVYFLITSLPVNALELKTASFNIRLVASVDGVNEWKYRTDLVEKTLNGEDLDIIGFQEVTYIQLIDLQKMLPGYSYFGVGREDFKEKGEYVPIFYKKGRFQLIEGDHFVLAEDIREIGKISWDAACTRMVSWVLLEDLKTKQRFYYFNTHFDHIGKVAQKKSAELLSATAFEKSKHYPVIITGDFNSAPTSEAYEIMTQKFTDSKTIAKKVKGVPYSYQGFKKIDPTKYSLIDFIFVSSSIKVKKHCTIFKEENGILISDHNLIITELEL